MPRKLKDVKAGRDSRPTRAEKKTPDTLPKILDVARRTGSLCAQSVRCSKPGCRCSRGKLHEGYYYFFWVTPSGRLSKRYVRRGDVPAVREVIEARRGGEAAFRTELKRARALLLSLISKSEVKS